MKIVCEGIELSEAVMKVSKACSAKTTTPILETVKITAKNDVLTLLATDGEIAIQKSIRAEVLEEGALCVPGKYFADFIKRLENEQISMATEEGKVVITYGDAVSSMQVLSADDFPAIDTDVNENRVELSAKDLKELISKTTFCCAQDDSRPVLKGCLIETREGYVCFTALDGYRMAVCRKSVVSTTGDVRIVCPGRTLNEIARMVGDEESVCLYQDGELIASSADITLRPSDIQPLLNYIGHSQFAADPNFNGYIDDFRVYDYALSADEIKKLTDVSSGICGTPMDEPSAFSVSPLPADSHLDILYQSDNGTEKVEFRIYDLQGHLAATASGQNGTTVSIQTSHLADGVYILKAQCGTISHSKKFTVRHP